MPKGAAAFFLAMTLLGGCKASPDKSGSAAVVEAAPPVYSEPPTIDAGLSVEQAYAAIPHRRTVWAESESSVPSQEKAYLSVMFQVLDQAVAVRVASLQNYSNKRFDDSDTDAQFERLITFVRGMPVPNALSAYHKDILDGLSGQRRFFQDWKSARGGFAYAQQIGNHAAVRSSSAALRAAYNELMAKYPSEAQANKDAFFDYHCALDSL
jgi:hypothetical protein